MSRRGVAVLGLAAAGGVGYYLYSAGGDPKVAQKQFEADASKASAKIKSEIPGREKEAEKKGEQYAQELGNKFDKTVSDARSKTAEMEAKAKAEYERASKEVNKGINQFDKTVEKKAAEAKSGISSWFGGSK